MEEQCMTADLGSFIILDGLVQEYGMKMKYLDLHHCRWIFGSYDTTRRYAMIVFESGGHVL